VSVVLRATALKVSAITLSQRPSKINLLVTPNPRSSLAAEGRHSDSTSLEVCQSVARVNLINETKLCDNLLSETTTHQNSWNQHHQRVQQPKRWAKSLVIEQLWIRKNNSVLKSHRWWMSFKRKPTLIRWAKCLTFWRTSRWKTTAKLSTMITSQNQQKISRTKIDNFSYKQTINFNSNFW